MSKKIFINDAWELNTFLEQMRKTGIVDVEGKLILTVYLVDRTKVIFHCTLRSILIQNENGRTNFDYDISYHDRVQDFIWKAVPQLRKIETPKFMALIASKYGEAK